MILICMSSLMTNAVKLSILPRLLAFLVFLWEMSKFFAHILGGWVVSLLLRPGHRACSQHRDKCKEKWNVLASRGVDFEPQKCDMCAIIPLSFPASLERISSGIYCIEMFSLVWGVLKRRARHLIVVPHASYSTILVDLFVNSRTICLLSLVIIEDDSCNKLFHQIAENQNGYILFCNVCF